MINKVAIENFKSIKQLSFNCKRINVIIGKPNTGKSNIIEALGLFSPSQGSLKEIIRFKEVSNLFFDNIIGNQVSVKVDETEAKIHFNNNIFWLLYKEDNRQYQHQLNDNGSINPNPAGICKTRYYKFKEAVKFYHSNASELSCPSGSNLFDLLVTNRELQDMVAEILDSFGYKLNLRMKDMEIEFVKQSGNILISYPYQNISDTLQRIIFHYIAIETNKNNTIIFEEPEANTFPFYTKHLAERIALDDSNQYIIVTHNPYLLSAITQKTKLEDLQVIIAETKDYSTVIHIVDAADMPRFIELDSEVFFDLDKFLK
jgi:AAA15 family ATPase/GTPase